ncbi:MAG: TRAP transporter small permease [Candidatus Caldatribacteriota bacterium]
MEKFLRFYELVGRAEKLIVGFLLVIIVCTIFAAGFGRSLGYPIRWAMDFSTFLFAWAVFFGADVAMREDRHMNVEILVSKLPKRVQSYLILLNYVIIIIFLIFLIVYGIKLSYITRFRAFQGIPGFSYTWVTLSVPVGCISLLMTILLKIWNLVKKEKLQILKLK